jgi:heptosyltransferase-2
VLVVGPSWLGDAVMAQSLYMTLKRSPGTDVDVLTPPFLDPLLEMMPQVSRRIASSFRRGRLDLGARYRIGRELAAGGYDQAIVLPNSWKSALAPWFARIPLRTGYLGEQRRGLLNDARTLAADAMPTTVQRFVALAAPAGAPPPDPHALPPVLAPGPGVRHTASDFALEPGSRPIMVLCPGAEYGPSKQWPVRNFAEVARARLDEGWQVWILGSDKDAATAGEIDSLCMQRCSNLAGRTSITQAVHLMSLATVVVSNDSGLMHVAAALGAPVVAIFGSTDPAHTPPLTNKQRIAYLGLPCSPCFKRRCPLEHLNCLKGISPRSVIQAVDELCAY